MRKIKNDVDDDMRREALARAAALLESADKADAMVIADVISCVCEVLRSESGAMVVMVDMEGNGRADMLAVGNQFVIGPLLSSAPYIGRNFYATAPEVVQ